MNQKIGFVGVGRMGANMARKLKDKGYEISSVNDVNKEAAAEKPKKAADSFGFEDEESDSDNEAEKEAQEDNNEKENEKA